MPECPECQQELTYHDFYGTNMHLDSFGMVKSGFVKTGDIYKCKNEECACFDDHFFTRNGELQQGYPC